MALTQVKRVILIVLDSVGIGALPDAGDYGDAGANTLVHIAERVGGLALPQLAQLGLGNLDNILGIAPEKALGAFGKLKERSMGKDTTTGHWELAGLELSKPFPTYPDGFPKEVIDAFVAAIGSEVLGNVAASGTEIIEQLGSEHLLTQKPIVYTSADSVFQIAAHEEVISVERLYEIAKIARKILVGAHAVGRVIARPFVGRPGNFQRTKRRQDFSLEPPQETILDLIKEAGLEVMGVGKISNIFAHRGLTRSNHTATNMDSVDALLEFMDLEKAGLIFANLVEFDMLYGHRNDVTGYAKALEEFDQRLPEIFQRMKTDDLLVITADHGCDPTHPGSDHTREYVPILMFSSQIKANYDLQIRESFADLAASIAEMLGVTAPRFGKSFAWEILKEE